MRAILTPAETLGLSGAVLEGHVRSAAHRVPEAVLARLAERLRADAWENRLIYERDGVEEPVRIMLRPLLVMAEQLSYVHYVCQQLIEALKRLPGLYLQDARVRRILAITEDEEAWFRSTWTPAHDQFNSVYGRLDAVCDFTGAGWQDSLHFMEPNLAGVGGIYYSPIAEELVLRDVVPTLFANQPGLAIQLPRDQRDLFVQLLMDHARTIGRNDCRLCFIDAKYVHEGASEQAILSEHLSRKHGLVIAHADPRELRVEGDKVYYEDLEIDVAYRDYGVLELIEYEREIGERLEAMRLLFRQNRIVSSMVGEFDHKSAFEVLTDPAHTDKCFSADEFRLFRRHVLWTRLVGDRKTTLPGGREGDLLRYARDNRELLVLKPNRSYGGKGVVIGAGVNQAEWEHLLDEAAALYEDPEYSSVVQAAARLPVYEFPLAGENGQVFAEPFYAVMGFAATDHGLGTMCRVSQKQVVNVAQRGGLAAVLEAEAPWELAIPDAPQTRPPRPSPDCASKSANCAILTTLSRFWGGTKKPCCPPWGGMSAVSNWQCWKVFATRFLFPKIWAITSNRSRRISVTAATGHANWSYCAACAGKQSRFHRILSANLRMRGRVRWAHGRKRTRATTLAFSRSRLTTCSDCFATKRRLWLKWIPTMLFSTKMSRA